MDKLNFKDFGLDKDILESIEKLGYKNPSEIQQKVIPIIMSGQDVIAKSQTGSGKTAAFAIPICEKVELEERNPQVLVLAPTRELAFQIKDDFTDIGRFKRLRCIQVIGKEPVTDQMRELKQRVHIVVGTPGRTFDLIKRGYLKVDKIKYLVIDEADEMLNMGFIDQVKDIVKSIPKERQTFLFSATLGKEITELCSDIMTKPVSIEVKSKNNVYDRIDQKYYEVENMDKVNLLLKVICGEKPESCIIFCRTKENVDNLVLKMKNRELTCNGLHGGLMQDERNKVIDRFRKGEFIFLVATDIAARGIDIQDINLIINYDIPLEKEKYIHRIGRTGRAGKSGTAVTFVTPHEHRFLKDIMECYGFNIRKAEPVSEREFKEQAQEFKKVLKKAPVLKKSKDMEVNKGITKLYIGAGKKKKIRPGDIAGMVSSVDGINHDDVGIIDIHDEFSYVEVLSGKGDIALAGLKHRTLKGKEVRCARARK